MTSIVQAVARQKTVPEKPWERSWISLVVFVEPEKWWEILHLTWRRNSRTSAWNHSKNTEDSTKRITFSNYFTVQIILNNNKTIIGFIFRMTVWQIICISEGDIRLSRSNNCKIFAVLFNNWNYSWLISINFDVFSSDNTFTLVVIRDKRRVAI